MLGKLLKYEIKDTARIIPFLYLITIIFSALSFISKKLDLGWITITSSFLLIVVGIAVVIITFVVIVIRFSRNLYSNEGYLMFTLPVKPQLLLVSKTVVAFSWIIISLIILTGALFVGMYGFGFDFNELAKNIAEFEKYGLGNIFCLLIPMILLLVIYLIAQIFFSITVANRPAFHGLGTAAGFLVFLATYTILQVVNSVLAIFIPLSVEVNLVGNVSASLSSKNMLGFIMQSMDGNEPTTIIIGLGGYIFEVIITFVLFYMTGRMMNKKVSLK